MLPLTLNIDKQKQARAEAYAARRAAGLCTKCDSTERVKGCLCGKCRESKEESRRKTMGFRNKNGLCQKCGNRLAGKFPVSRDVTWPMCSRCFFRHAARKHLGDANKWHLLHDMFVSQKGCCAYTGEVLVIRGNASLDHKVPRSRGGSNELSNLHWVAYDVNEIKSSMTHEEFLKMCRQVVRQHGS